MFNSPQYFSGHIGHCGILFEDGDGPVRLYSFHPILNQGEYFDKGSVAHIANPNDATSFEKFEQSCLIPHPDIDHRKDNRGIILNNGTVEWNERIRRVIRMGISQKQFEAMVEYADEFSKHPHSFNFITYSCQHFVNDVLKAGGVEPRDKRFPMPWDLIPNSVFDRTNQSTKGIISFEKIYFD